VEIAISHPPSAGDRPMVLNQVTETHRVIDLADLVADTAGGQIAFLPNPRVEEEENDLAVRNDHFIALGLRPTTLSEGLLTEVREVAARYAHRADPRKIVARTVWRSGMPCGDDPAPVRLPPRGPPPVSRRCLMRFADGHRPIKPIKMG
jgi:UDP-sulfoquinovose synthase